MSVVVSVVETSVVYVAVTSVVYVAASKVVSVVVTVVVTSVVYDGRLSLQDSHCSLVEGSNWLLDDNSLWNSNMFSDGAMDDMVIVGGVSRDAINTVDTVVRMDVGGVAVTVVSVVRCGAHRGRRGVGCVSVVSTVMFSITSVASSEDSMNSVASSTVVSGKVSTVMVAVRALRVVKRVSLASISVVAITAGGVSVSSVVVSVDGWKDNCAVTVAVRAVKVTVAVRSVLVSGSRDRGLRCLTVVIRVVTIT